jgi:hypothetical protein
MYTQEQWEALTHVHTGHQQRIILCVRGSVQLL